LVKEGTQNQFKGKKGNPYPGKGNSTKKPVGTALLQRRKSEREVIAEVRIPERYRVKTGDFVDGSKRGCPRTGTTLWGLKLNGAATR